MGKFRNLQSLRKPLELWKSNENFPILCIGILREIWKTWKRVTLKGILGSFNISQKMGEIKRLKSLGKDENITIKFWKILFCMEKVRNTRKNRKISWTSNRVLETLIRLSSLNSTWKLIFISEALKTRIDLSWRLF